MVAKQIIKRFLHGLGYEIRSLNGPSTGSAPDIWTWLRKSGCIKTILDVGANNGEFAEYLSTHFDAEQTVAIEPIPACAAKVRQRNRAIRNLTVIECAVSDYDGRAVLFENPYAPASSLLSVSKISKEEFPETAGQQKEVEVAVHRLDDLINRDIFEKEILLKIDVQGLEDRVIRGGEKTFTAAKFVMVEMSFVPMYEGQPLFEEVHELLVNIGFRFAGIKNQICSSTTGKPLFMHCLYVNQGV